MLKVRGFYFLCVIYIRLNRIKELVVFNIVLILLIIVMIVMVVVLIFGFGVFGCGKLIGKLILNKLMCLWIIG